MANGRKVLGIVLAGGQGTRLLPLTADRAKPAVPFGGIYRLIDFVLSNLVNGGFLKIVVLTQYKNHSLDRHITTTWRMSTLLGNYVTPVPAQQRVGPRWFAGSADAIYQSLNLVHDERPDYILVFGADHIYRMDPRQMLDLHIASGASATVAGIRAPRKEASAFGVIQTAHTGRDAGRRIEAFLEKPQDIEGRPLLEVLPGLILDQFLLPTSRQATLPDLEVGGRVFSPRISIPPSDDEGNTTITLRDVTDLRQRESRRVDFYSMVAHDLRSPLSALQMRAMMLLQGLRGAITAEVRQELDKMVARVRDLVQTVNDFLDIAQMESAHFQVAHDPVDLAPLCTEVYD